MPATSSLPDPGDDDRVEELQKVLRGNGVGGVTPWSPYDTSRFESGDWRPWSARPHVPRRVGIAVAVLLLVLVGAALVSAVVGALTH